MDSSILALLQLVVLIFSVIIHEVSHGAVALALGDDTAQREGRLTLDPRSHLDPVGSILLPLVLVVTNSPFLIGWAKPVPYNPLAMHKDYRYGSLKVAIAGPLSNLALAVFFGLIIRFFGDLIGGATLLFLSYIVLLNSVLFIFNMLPIPPLDGSKVLSAFLPFEWRIRLERVGLEGMFLIIFVIMFFSGFIYGATRFLFNVIVGV